MKIRSLTEMMNEILCDNILRKFEGSHAIDRDQLNEQSFYNNLDPDSGVVENHVNFLILDKTLQERGNTISLTTKGWFILTNADKVGYVAQKVENVEREISERETKLMFRWTALCATGVVLSWLVYNLVFVAA
jgi:hypothetical protein